MTPMPSRERRYDGVHCTLVIEQPSASVIVLRIRGSDVGEFGEAPMHVLDEWLDGSGVIDFFVDAREVRGASVDVSAEWARWLSRNKSRRHAVTMLTGSRFIQVTAEFVRRFADLEGLMRICTEPAVFDAALRDVLDF